MILVLLIAILKNQLEILQTLWFGIEWTEANGALKPNSS